MKKLNFFVLVLFAAIVVSCKKDKDKDEAPPKDYPFYFTGDINGLATKYQADDEIDSKFTCNIAQSQRPGSGVEVDILEGTAILDKQTIPSNMITVSVLKYFDHAPGAGERVAMIATGNLAYGASHSNSTTVNGVSIQFTDANGNLWNSENGTQAGSTFNITEVVESTDAFSDKIFKATFSCKVYNGTGGSMPISNATIRGRILSP